MELKGTTMKTFKLLLSVMLVFCSLLLVIYGFCGNMPSWMGAIGWLGLLFSYITSLINIIFENTEKKIINKIINEVQKK